MTSDFRSDPLNVAVNSGHCLEDTVIPPVQVNSNCGGKSVLRVKRSLRRRNGIDYCVLDYSSEEELDNGKPICQSKHSRQTNDICGKAVGCKFEQVTARWSPIQACRPIIDEAPVFYPTEEDFRDALGYIASIRSKAEQYGICRIVPPPSWKPSCPLKERSVWKVAKFSTRVQQVDKLQNREPTRKRSRNRCQRKRKRRKGLRFGMTRRRNNCTTTETDDGSSDTEEKFGFQSGSEFTLQSFQIYAENFKEQYFGMRVSKNSESCCNVETDIRWQPSVEEIEGEYWRIVENPSDEVEVLYGADLETGIFGSGFPKVNSAATKGLDPHVYSGWNLNNFPRLPGSVLSFESEDISGVLVPWLYIGMCFSSFCWHVEDHHLYSLNYMHWGDPKIWYGVPGNAALKLEQAMKKHLPELFEAQPDLLHELVTQLSPSVLKSEGVPVFRAIQKAGEFVLTFPRAYHSGFNCGFNCAEAVNVAPMDWLSHGQCAVELYSEQRRKTSISHDKLLMGAARGAVRALWDLLLLGLDKPYNLKWQTVCGKEGILTKAVRARVAMEQEQRASHCTSTKVMKMDEVFDLSKERECFFCFYDLHLSAAGCECSSDRYACLNHADLLCSCEPSRRFFLFRYSMDQLNTLVQALDKCLSAVLHWGSYDLGLVPPSNVVVDEEPKLIDKSDSKLVLQKSISASKKELVNIKVASIDCSSLSEFNSTACSERMEAVFDISEHSMLGNKCALEVVDASLKTELESGDLNAEHMEAVFDISEQTMSGNTCALGVVDANLKTELESGDSNRTYINTDLVDLQHTEYMCHIIASKKNDIFSSDNIWEEPRWCLDLNNDDLTQDCKVKIEGWSCRTGVPTKNIIKEKNCNLTAVKADMEYESIATSSTLLESSPEGGSSVSLSNFLEFSHSCAFQNRQMNEASSSRAKLFGIDLHQPQPLLPVNSNSEGKQPFTNGWPKSIGPNSGNPDTDKHLTTSLYFAEPLHFGTAMFGKQWCNKQAIFPKGFRSRVRYFSVLDPTTTCFYISEVLDAGLIGPLFKVTLEDNPEDTFMHSSPQQCWDLVRERLNQEILKQCSLGNQYLPTLQPTGSIDGLQMFGFLSPSISQVIESLDRDHRCLEYWASKSSSPSKNDPKLHSTTKFTKAAPPHTELRSSATYSPPQNASSVRQGKIFGVDITKLEHTNSVSDDEVEHVLGPLFHRLKREELEVMHKILISGSESDCWRAAHKALLNELEKNVDEQGSINFIPKG